MQAETTFPARVELSTKHPENLILVENHGDGGVCIRAVEDNFSSERKYRFVRYLVMEGYIPEHRSSFTWTVDASWLATPYALQQKSRRRLFVVMLWAVVLWLALMVFAFLHAPP
jgi:hypothetical protein